MLEDIAIEKKTKKQGLSTREQEVPIHLPIYLYLYMYI